MLIEFRAGELTEMLSRLQAVQDQLKNKDTSDDAYIEAHLNDFEILADKYESLCKRLNIDISASASQLKSRVRYPEKSSIELWIVWRDFRREIVNGLVKHSLMYIPKPEKDFYNQKMLFGKKIYDNFPSARYDIETAGTCYAVGSYTACVFHSMRAVEIGAREMVKRLKVQRHLPPNRPIELCDWGKLRIALDKGIDVLEIGSSQSLVKKEKFEFYNHAVGVFKNFKDAWRNNVSHTRKIYKAGETKDIMDNTRQFMKHIAVKIKEPKARITDLDDSDVW